jgi:hypothetical protein
MVAGHEGREHQGGVTIGPPESILHKVLRMQPARVEHALGQHRGLAARAFRPTGRISALSTLKGHDLTKLPLGE